MFAGTKKKKKQAEKDQGVLPVHIAIIMDGNGRWAGKRLAAQRRAQGGCNTLKGSSGM